MEIHFLNHEEWKIDAGLFTPFAERLRKQVTEGPGVLNVVFVNDTYIHALNKRYRKKDAPTDVLSFTYNQDGLIGEIYISVETAKKQAGDFGHSLADELSKLFVHGFLHIHGHDHENDADYRRMHAVECAVLGKDMT